MPTTEGTDIAIVIGVGVVIWGIGVLCGIAGSTIGGLL